MKLYRLRVLLSEFPLQYRHRKTAKFVKPSAFASTSSIVRLKFDLLLPV